MLVSRQCVYWAISLRIILVGPYHSRAPLHISFCWRGNPTKIMSYLILSYLVIVYSIFTSFPQDEKSHQLIPA